MASYDSRQCRAKQLHLRKSCSKMRDMLRHYGPTKKQSNQISVVVGGISGCNIICSLFKNYR